MSSTALIFINIILIPTVFLGVFFGSRTSGLDLAHFGFAAFMTPIAAFYTWIRVSNRSIESKKQIIWIAYASLWALAALLLVAMLGGPGGGGLEVVVLIFYFAAISIPLFPLNFLMFYLMGKPEAEQRKISLFLFAVFFTIFLLQAAGFRGYFE